MNAKKTYQRGHNKWQKMIMKHSVFSFILFSHDTTVFQLQLEEEASGFQ